MAILVCVHEFLCELSSSRYNYHAKVHGFLNLRKNNIINDISTARRSFKSLSEIYILHKYIDIPNPLMTTNLLATELFPQIHLASTLHIQMTAHTRLPTLRV